MTMKPTEKEIYFAYLNQTFEKVALPFAFVYIDRQAQYQKRISVAIW